jgi:hypothetical protein
LVIQLLMVGVVIAFPGLVLASLEHGPKIDINKIQIEMPQQRPSEAPAIDFK